MHVSRSYFSTPAWLLSLTRDFRWGCWGWDCSPDQPCKSGLSCYGGYCKDKDPNNSTSPTTSQAAPTSTVAAAHNSGTDAVAGVSIVGVISLPAIVGIIVFFMR